MKALKIEHLNFSYEKNRPTIKDVSFSIEEGERVALIGHNGSGKSTIAKLIAGLLGGFEGSIEVLGLPLNKANVIKIRDGLGLVFQNPDNQFVASTVRLDIAFSLENRNVKREDMDPIINRFAEEVGMKDYLDKAPENLSGGQKQRVAIAGALCSSPRLLILDEATSMLDPKGKKEILDLVDELRKKDDKLSILSITHDIEEAALSDKVIVLNQGSVVLEGTPKEVFAHEEELKQIDLSLPFFNELVSSLRKEGIEVPSDIEDLDGLEGYLCR